MDPNPDYDVSDEIEFFMRYLGWGLRGVTTATDIPPPAYPPVLRLAGYSALSSSATSVTDFFASPNSMRGALGVEQRVVDARRSRNSSTA